MRFKLLTLLGLVLASQQASAMTLVATCTNFSGTKLAGSGKTAVIDRKSLEGTLWTYSWYAGRSEAKVTFKLRGGASISKDATLFTSSDNLVTLVVFEKDSFWTHTLWLNATMDRGIAVVSEHSLNEQGNILGGGITRGSCKIEN